MAKKNSGKKEETTVDTNTQVVETTPNTNEEVATMTTTEPTTEVVAESKSSKAQAIYVEEAAKGDEKLRARVIGRLKSELGMSPQGASTYFQNCKTKAAGGKVKHYRPKSTKAQTTEQTDDSQENAVLIDVKAEDGTIHSFTTQEAAEQHIAEKGGEIVTDEEAEQEAA